MSLRQARPSSARRAAAMAAPGLSERRGPLGQRALAKDSVVRHMDWVLIAAVLALALIGTLLVWSATRAGLEQVGGNPNTYLEKAAPQRGYRAGAP